MHCTDCGQKQHKDGCVQNRSSQMRSQGYRRLSDLPDVQEPGYFEGNRVSQTIPNARGVIWAVYTKADDIAALISIHNRSDDAIRHAGGDETYQVCQLPYGMDLQVAVKLWEDTHRKINQNEEKRAELRAYLEDRGYSPEKIEELVYHSDDA